MNPFSAALLVNLLGFTVGAALYVLLAMMVLRGRGTRAQRPTERLLLVTAGLGVIWNVGELAVYLVQDFVGYRSLPFASAAAYSALGFLPSAVVHSARADRQGTGWLSYAAYALSTGAAALHFWNAAAAGAAPSETGLQILSVGSLVLAAGLLLFNFDQTRERKAIWVTALGVFAVSAFHLSGNRESSSWIIELVAHQSSLPLALVILYQNYRFAFADLFLKRALSLIFLASLAFVLYIAVAAPLLRYHETHDRNDAQAISLILTLWIATALIYPRLYAAAVWLVDRVVLKRADYDALQVELARSIEKLDSQEEVLTAVCEALGGALTSGDYGWEKCSEAHETYDLVAQDPDAARVHVPTAEQPHFRLRFESLGGGRRLLSDETAMLESVALITSRRIDAIRVVKERYEQRAREQEFARLAAEAQLTALRAQINPHFLFNALTTIGYLIQTAPDKAFQTLLHLTRLLRSVLGANAEFTTLGDEVRLVRDYLDIEKARFEEKLDVSIEIPDELANLRVPALVLQPLVENAIKHGIAENRSGGSLTVTARKDLKEAASLKLEVFDTGSGRPLKKRSRGTGTGLDNTRKRLAAYYGDASGVELATHNGGTLATVTIPLAVSHAEKRKISLTL